MRTRSGIAVVRTARPEDAESLNGVSNPYVGSSPATFAITPTSLEERRAWLAEHPDRGPYRVVVAEFDGQVVGFASSSRYRSREAYATSVETSVYVASGSAGRGIGTALYEALLAELALEDLHRAYAGITMPNPPSVALHRRFGFEQVAYFTEQGRKFGRYWDVAWFEKPL